jgi:hypothetical protein
MNGEKYSICVTSIIFTGRDEREKYEGTIIVDALTNRIV